MRIITALAVGLFILSGMGGQAYAYPAAGAEPEDGCKACHTSPDFEGGLVVKLLRIKDGKKVVNDYNAAKNTIFIPMKRGDTVSYKLVLGHKDSGKASTVGWLWKLPSGVETQLPNCVRKLEMGQPWTKYTDTDGEKHNVKHHTVAGQTFYFSGTTPNRQLEGELRVSLGRDGKGPEYLTGHTIKLVFVPTE
ncbi:hypothetical protein MNBD_NITROSPINAE01-1936 [hydrothermal vent metagenome]|uniref:Uncharacterized protein n=1 Tax=hydrothermal vent metagenome TaxID=652676 RepID=A0A3B1BN56_9ZZZZ